MQFEPWKSQVSGVPYSHWDPLVWDGIAQYYPWRAFAAETLRSGVLPLWNPYQFCGTPFIANGQSAVFYPLNVLFWLLPTAVAFGWSAWLHLALTGWFAYLFLRRIGTGHVGSVAGAAVWQGNGFFMAWVHLPTVLCTASWLPLILLLIEKALVHGPRYSADPSALGSPSPGLERGPGGEARPTQFATAVLAGVALGIAYLGGHPQVFLFVALLAASYLLTRALTRPVRQELAPALTRLLTAGLLTASSTLGLASVQLIPTLDLLRIAHRASVPGPESYRFFLSHAMPPLQLASLVLPHPFGHPALGSYVGRDNYAEFACYIGIIALALALWAAFAFRTWHARFLGATALVVFLIALGTPINQPLYRWLPGFDRTGGPGRTLLLAAFALSLLAGMAVDELPRRLAQRRPLSLAAPILLLAALGIGVRLWHELATPSLAQVQPALLRSASAEASRAGALLAAAVLILAAAWRWSKPELGRLVLLPLLALDLALAAQGHLHISPRAWVYPPVGIASGQEQAPAQQRILGNAKDWPINRFPDAVLPPNSATVYRLRDAFGYDSLYLARYRDFAAAIEHGDPSPPLNGNMLLARFGPVYGLDMMSLAGVETVLSPAHVRGLKMETAGAYYTYSNPYARPRAWVASSAVFVPTHLQAVVSLAELGPMPDTIIITGPDDLGAPSLHAERGRGGEVLLRDLSPNAVQVATRGASGYLFLADAFAPGWRALAGPGSAVASLATRRELPIRPANVAFRTVALPLGAEWVLFRYEPDSFRVGLFATLASLAIVAAVGAQAAARRGSAT